MSTLKSLAMRGWDYDLQAREIVTHHVPVETSVMYEELCLSPPAGTWGQQLQNSRLELRVRQVHTPESPYYW